MRLIFSILILQLAWFFPQASNAQKAWCQLQGPVFIDSNPTRVQYRVYEEESESFADLLVFKAANALFADKPGLWYFTEARAQATIGIMFVKERSLADFSIYFVETESFAGCQTSR